MISTLAYFALCYKTYDMYPFGQVIHMPPNTHPYILICPVYVKRKKE